MCPSRGGWDRISGVGSVGWGKWDGISGRISGVGSLGWDQWDEISGVGSGTGSVGWDQWGGISGVESLGWDQLRARLVALDAH